ncbi:hypothetical protein [Brachyspira murdochii]|uniref:Uncharacterized protein n=1 Tax=Brachyspira murdochii TaxID=84378 RepID=A0ABX5B828_9SPIR|nr:hypothetical protein [Brachyspira murdochii]PPS22944.1 hypothetical protein DJ52_01745 [Brachyspira murdochii]
MINAKKRTKKTIVVSGADIIKAVHSDNKNIDCEANYKKCIYFDNGECNHKTVSNLDEAVICPYYLVNKED